MTTNVCPTCDAPIGPNDLVCLSCYNGPEQECEACGAYHQDVQVVSVTACADGQAYGYRMALCPSCRAYSSPMETTDD